MQVERHREVKVRYQDLLGESHEIQAGPQDDLAELLQHEIDHLEGILAVIALQTCVRCARGKSSRKDTEPRARTRQVRRSKALT